jgi:predicted MFS family arabinose efflux permease
MLEIPREIPGFLVVFVSAILFFLCSRRLASLANLLMAIGIFLVGFFSINYSLMLMFLFICSVGQHLFLPLNSTIGMELAKDGKTGKVLGQLSGAGNIFAILGSFVIFLGFNFLNFNFKNSFTIASIGFLIASFFIFLMNPGKPTTARSKFKLKKEYKLFYWLNILYGTRKQLFLTFAPWVLVTVYHQKTQVVATLLTIGGVIGIGFKPLLGRAIDKLGEKVILAGEAVVLIFVCIGYGFSKNLFPETIALFITFVCYIMDQLLMSVGMARATYLKKIALAPEDVSQTLTMGVTIDHIFSVSIAIAGGFILLNFGFQYIFLIGGIIALINFFSTLKINTSKNIA